jgi:hypothetical protein
LQLDDRMKQLLRELGHAINDSVSDSERIAEAIAGVRAAGFDIVLKLDATIGLAKRTGQSARMTSQDRRFLESLHIRVDDEAMQEEEVESKVEITAQDIKFLKSWQFQRAPRGRRSSKQWWRRRSSPKSSRRLRRKARPRGQVGSRRK